MTNFLAAYSPDRNFQTEEEYLTLYPDDDIVDILGIDNYWDLQSPEGRRDAIKKLEIVANYALKTGKIAAFTETGSDKLLNDKWFTEMLGYVLNASSLTRQIVYVMVWPNHDLSHFYVPYPWFSPLLIGQSYRFVFKCINLLRTLPRQETTEGDFYTDGCRNDTAPFISSLFSSSTPSRGFG